MCSPQPLGDPAQPSAAAGPQSAPSAACATQPLQDKGSTTSTAVSRRMRLVLLGASTALLAAAVLTVPSLTTGSPVALGDLAPRSLIANRDVTIVDDEATERARRTAAEQVPVVEGNAIAAQTQAVAAARAAFAAVRAARAPVPVADAVPGTPDAAEPSGADSATEARPQFEIPSIEGQVAAVGAAGWGDEAAALLVALDDVALAQIEAEAVQILQQLARSRLTEQNLASQVDVVLATELAVRALPQELATQVVAPLIRKVAAPTVTFDLDATQTARDQAAAAVAPVTVQFSSGALIVARGDPVSALQLAAAQELDLLGAGVLRVWPRMLVSVAALVALAGPSLTALPVTRIRSRSKRARLAAVLLLMYAAALAAVLVARPLEPSLVWATPAAALAVLAAATFGVRALPHAAAAAAVVSAAALPGRGELVVLSVALVLSVGTAAARFSARSDLRRLLAVSASAHAALAAALAVLYPSASATLTPSIAAVTLVGAVAGAVWTLLAVAILPALESGLRVVTGPGLSELADRGHPLLQRLERDALGTYQHSLLVAQLTAAALERVGGDALLGSVQALYHDIGKVSAPYFFIENQFGIDNPHDTIAPEVSAHIIHAHVADGVTLSRTYKLPVEVVDAIATHHGTLRVEAFYRKALAQDDGVDERTFRYPGPRPFTLETAVLMLADCCESATRANAQVGGSRLDRQAIANLVHSLFDARLADGQLADAPVTVAQLDAVAQVFIDTLEGIYHPRIVYPDLPSVTSGQGIADPQTSAG